MSGKVGHLFCWSALEDGKHSSTGYDTARAKIPMRGSWFSSFSKNNTNKRRDLELGTKLPCRHSVRSQISLLELPFHSSPSPPLFILLQTVWQPVRSAADSPIDRTNPLGRTECVSRFRLSRPREGEKSTSSPIPLAGKQQEAPHPLSLGSLGKH